VLLDVNDPELTVDPAAVTTRAVKAESLIDGKRTFTRCPALASNSKRAFWPGLSNLRSLLTIVDDSVMDSVRSAGTS
jgi:hypothetical protein